MESLPFRADPVDHRSVSTACQVVESFQKVCRAGSLGGVKETSPLHTDNDYAKIFVVALQCDGVTLGCEEVMSNLHISWPITCAGSGVCRYPACAASWSYVQRPEPGWPHQG